jgi:hypothetical protein
MFYDIGKQAALEVLGLLKASQDAPQQPPKPPPPPQPPKGGAPITGGQTGQGRQLKNLGILP